MDNKTAKHNVEPLLKSVFVGLEDYHYPINITDYINLVLDLDMNDDKKLIMSYKKAILAYRFK